MGSRRSWIRSCAAVLTAILSLALAVSPAAADLALTPEAEGNNDPASATPLSGASGAVEGRVFPNSDVDYYSFSAQAGDRVYVAIMTGFSGSNSFDSQVRIVFPDGFTDVESDDDDGSFSATSSSIAGATLPTAGTYFFRVNHSSVTLQLRPYRLLYVIRSGSPTPESEPNDAPGQAALPLSGWVSGSTASTADVDVYSLSLDAGDTVFLSLDLDPERDAVEWNGALAFGQFGNPPLYLQVNDPGAWAPDSEASFFTVKDAGTYAVMVSVDGGSATSGSYHLSAQVFPGVPATGTCSTYASTDVPVAIHDLDAPVSTLTVPGHPRIADINVELDLTHTLMSDLDVHLISPAGNDNGLFTDVGSASQPDMNLVLDDEAAILVSNYTAVSGMRVTPESNYRLSWFDGEDAGGTWTLQLRDDAANNVGTLRGWSITICEPAAAEACPAGTRPVTAFGTDFEAGGGGFTHAGTLDEWEWGLPAFAPVSGCNSGTGCWKTDLDNTYEAGTSQDLYSPAIDLRLLRPPILVRWAQKYQMESANYDHFFVDIQDAGGANPSPLFDWEGATMTNSVGAGPVQIQQSAGWGFVTRSADAYAGRVAELRFHLDADSSVQLAGVGIDDVSVTGCQVLCGGLPATIVGTEGNDTITGTARADVIAGLGGNDTINGAGGNDIICGGEGNDLLVGAGGNDRLFGEGGADRLRGGTGKDRLVGGSGKDFLDGGTEADRCDGGQHADRGRSCERQSSIP